MDDSEVISAGDMKRDTILELSQEMFEEEVLKIFFFVVFSSLKYHASSFVCFGHGMEQK